MRKTKMFVLASAAAMAASTLSVPATENVTAAKVRTDEYLIIDLAKVLDEVCEASTEAETLTEESSQAEDTAVDAYLDLFANEDAGGYTVTGAFADEPILKQLLSQNAAFAGFDAAGFYELTGDTREDLEQYQLNLVLADNANLYHYGIADGEFVKTPLEALFGEDQEKTVSLSSATNHWIVVHLKAAEAEKVDESASESEEGKAEESQEETSATEAETKEAETIKPTKALETTKVPETTKPTKASETAAPTTKAPETTAPTTKAPETAAPTTKAPETTAPTTTAHTHTWVPVTNTVHHDATYKTVWVQDSAAWDETVVTKDAWDENVLVQDAWDENVLVQDAWDEPTYSWVEICNACGHVFSAGESVGDHMEAGCWSSWHHEQRQTGSVHHEAVYNTVHHDAVYSTVHHEAETTVVHHEATGHNEQVVDQAAWDEDVVTGYKCSGCGATK